MFRLVLSPDDDGPAVPVLERPDEVDRDGHPGVPRRRGLGHAGQGGAGAGREAEQRPGTSQEKEEVGIEGVVVDFQISLINTT